jgi:hypothetical protein
MCPSCFSSPLAYCASWFFDLSLWVAIPEPAFCAAFSCFRSSSFWRFDALRSQAICQKEPIKRRMMDVFGKHLLGNSLQALVEQLARLHLEAVLAL